MYNKHTPIFILSSIVEKHQIIIKHKIKEVMNSYQLKSLGKF